MNEEHLLQMRVRRICVALQALMESNVFYSEMSFVLNRTYKTKDIVDLFKRKEFHFRKCQQSSEVSEKDFLTGC